MNDEFYDIEHAKEKLNVEMKRRLKPSEWRIYEMMFVNRKDDDIKEDTIKSYGISYPHFTKLRTLFIETAKKIIEEESLA